MSLTAVSVEPRSAPSGLLGTVLLTAVAPVLWGTTYFVSTAFLLSSHPLLTATLRALPAGLVLMLFSRKLPQGDWWWKSLVLGALNFGLFFAVLFIAADRLPGGVAAVIGGIQPLLVTFLAAWVLLEELSPLSILLGVGGIAGIALVVLRASAVLDWIGVIAAFVGAFSMAVGVVLTKKWGQHTSVIASTSWQMVAGGLLLAVATLVLEPLPRQEIPVTTIVGYLYLSLFGTAFAYLLWFRGIRRLPARVPSFLGLLIVLVAVALGAFAAHESLTWLQIVGVAIVLASVVGAVSTSVRSPAAGKPPYKK